MEGDKTIESKSDKKEVLGQRLGLSHTDVKRINKLYNCPKEDIGVKPDNDKSGNTPNKASSKDDDDGKEDDGDKTQSKQKAKR